MKKNSIFISLILLGISIVSYFVLFLILSPSKYTFNLSNTFFLLSIYSFPIIICYNLHNGKHGIFSDIGVMVCLLTLIYNIGIVWGVLPTSVILAYLIGLSVVLTYISFMLLQIPTNKFVLTLRYIGIVLICILYSIYIYMSFNYIELLYIVFIFLLVILIIITLLIIFINMYNTHKYKNNNNKSDNDSINNELEILKQKLIIGSITKEEYIEERNRILYK